MPGNEHIHLMVRFFTSFQQRDYAGMIACYHPQATFADPVFTDLKGRQIGAMWHMLCERSQNFALDFPQPQLRGETGVVRWEARYTFSATKRGVHNTVDTAMEFADNTIVRHRDHFDLWRWSRMALGLSGVLLGWSPIVRNKVRATAAESLRAFIATHPEYQ